MNHRLLLGSILLLGVGACVSGADELRIETLHIEVEVRDLRSLADRTSPLLFALVWPGDRGEPEMQVEMPVRSARDVLQVPLGPIPEGLATRDRGLQLGNPYVNVGFPQWTLVADDNGNGSTDLSAAVLNSGAGDRLVGHARGDEDDPFFREVTLGAILNLDQTLAQLTWDETNDLYRITDGHLTPWVRVRKEPSERPTLSTSATGLPSLSVSTGDLHLCEAIDAICSSVAGARSRRSEVVWDHDVPSGACPVTETCSYVDLAELEPPELTPSDDGTTRIRSQCRTAAGMEVLTILVERHECDSTECWHNQSETSTTFVTSVDSQPPWWPCGDPPFSYVSCEGPLIERCEP